MKLTEGFPKSVKARWYEALLGAMAGHTSIMSTIVFGLWGLSEGAVNWKEARHTEYAAETLPSQASTSISRSSSDPSKNTNVVTFFGPALGDRPSFSQKRKDAVDS